MKTHFCIFFLLSFLCFSSGYAQWAPRISNFNLHDFDTICADIDPWVKMKTDLIFGFGSGPVDHTVRIFDFGDGNSRMANLAEEVYHYYPKAGTYRIRADFQFYDGIYWQTASDSTLLVVEQGCQTSQSSSLQMKQDTACVGFPVQFGDSIPSPLSHLSFRWDFGDGNTSGEGWGVTHTYSQPGVYAASFCIIDRVAKDTNCIQELIHVKTCSALKNLRVVGPDTVCRGDNEYTFTPEVDCGTGDYAYKWHFFNAGSSFNPATDSAKAVQTLTFSGWANIVYSLTVTDRLTGNSISKMDSIYVVPRSHCPFEVEITHNDTAVWYGTTFNTIFTSQISGGTGNYSYSWRTSRGHSGTSSIFRPTLFSGGMMDIYLSVLDSGTYLAVDTLTVNVQYGMGSLANFIYHHLDVTLNPGSPCISDDIIFENPTRQVGSSKYFTHFLFDFGDGNIITGSTGVVRDTHRYTMPGIYTLKSCMYNPVHTDTFCRIRQLYVAPTCRLDAEVVTTPDDGTGTGTAKLYLRNGSGNVTFDWDSSGNYFSTHELQQIPAGTYHVVTRKSNGQTDTLMYRIPYESSVFPGDCNHDQVANMQDLLPIGLKYGNWGPLRPQANLTWTAQPAPRWLDTLANGRDTRHVDTDGDGIITDDDTLAIQLNYGFTHTNLKTANAGPKLFYDMPPGPHNLGDTLRIPVHLATMDTPVVNIYGLTFTMTMDTALVSAGAQFDFSSSWLGTKSSNLLTMYREDSLSGRIDVGFVRKDQRQISGFGRICDIIVVLDDHIGKRNIPLRMGFDGAYAIDKFENELSIGWIDGEANIATSVSGNSLPEGLISVGQSEDRFIIYHPTLSQGQWELCNLQGREISRNALEQGGVTQVSYGALTAGVYLLRLQTKQGSWQQKLVVLPH